MEPLKLLFLSLCLIISLNYARSARLTPSFAPFLQPASSPSPSPSSSSSSSPSPSPSTSTAQAPDSSRRKIDLSPSESQSIKVEPDYDSDTSSDGIKLNSETTLDIKKDDGDNSSSDDKKDDSDYDSSPDNKNEDFDSSSDDKKDDSDSSSDDKKAASDLVGADLHAVEVHPELKKICDQTDHASLCIATVRPFVKDNTKANIKNVLQVAVEASSAFAKQASSEAKKLAAKPGTSENLRSTIQDCEDGYDTAVENFQNTLDAFASDDLGTMRAMLSAVITYVGDCQDEFSEMQVKSPLTDYSEKLTEMASNALAITSLESGATE